MTTTTHKQQYNLFTGPKFGPFFLHFYRFCATIGAVTKDSDEVLAFNNVTEEKILFFRLSVTNFNNSLVFNNKINNQWEPKMAISKDKKNTLVADLTELLNNSKMTVFAKYQGLTVAELQELRKAAREQGVKIKVVKNRLVRVAMDSVAVYKDTNTTNLVGQLLYAISDTDEVAPAKVLANFAKTHDMLVVAGGFNDSGAALSDADVKALAALPSKNELIGQVVAQLLSPLNDSVSGLANGVSEIVSGLENKAA